jgi:hypothetical protein
MVEGDWVVLELLLHWLTHRPAARKQLARGLGEAVVSGAEWLEADPNSISSAAERLAMS